MKFDAEELDNIREYLLGQLPQEDAAQLEETLLSDGDFFEELLIAEDELIDQYLSGDLSQAERPRFETHFLAAPERQQKVRFARSLKKYVGEATDTKPRAEFGAVASAQLSIVADKVRAEKRSFFTFLRLQKPIIVYPLTATVLFAVIGISWAVFHNLRPKPPVPGKVLLVTLTPGLIRETGAIKSIHIPPDVGFVQLQLELISDEYQSYRAELLNSEKGSVLVKEDLKPGSAAGNKIIDVTVPVGLLKRDDYRVALSGRRADGSYEDIAGYFFRLVE